MNCLQIIEGWIGLTLLERSNTKYVKALVAKRTNNYYVILKLKKIKFFSQI